MGPNAPNGTGATTRALAVALVMLAAASSALAASMAPAGGPVIKFLHGAICGSGSADGTGNVLHTK